MNEFFFVSVEAVSKKNIQPFVEKQCCFQNASTLQQCHVCHACHVFILFFGGGA